MNNHLNYNPDVLSCLANLSNDEVFTPPQLANQMLDMLATDYGIRLAAVIRSQIGFFLQEQGGRHLTMDDIPDGLGIAPIEGDVSLQEMVDLLTKTKQEFMTLKDRVL